MSPRIPTLLFAALLQSGAVLAPSVVVPIEAQAVVGRPATPRSVAGVSRRTSRRVTTRHVARRPVRYGAPVAGAVVAGAAITATALAIGTVVASQPSGCHEQIVNGLTYMSCDGTWFQPQYQDGQVVYVVVAPPG